MDRQQILVKMFSTLLIVSTCLADEIVLKNNNSYSGDMVKFIEDDRILFKALPSTNLIIDITEIQNLTLYNNTVTTENGKLLVDDYRKTDDLYYGKVFMTGIFCKLRYYGGLFVLDNITLIDLFYKNVMKKDLIAWPEIDICFEDYLDLIDLQFSLINLF